MVTNIKQGFKEGMPRRTNSVGKVYTDPTEYTLAVERTHIQENAKHYDKYTKKKRVSRERRQRRELPTSWGPQCMIESPIIGSLKI